MSYYSERKEEMTLLQNEYGDEKKIKLKEKIIESFFS